MRKEVRLSLAYRDMWQSWGRYFPSAAQLKEVAPAIIRMGCFDRVETNGGAFEQVCLLMGRYPDHDAGARTQRIEDEPSAGGCPRTDVQGQEGTRN